MKSQFLLISVSKNQANPIWDQIVNCKITESWIFKDNNTLATGL